MWPVIRLDLCFEEMTLTAMRTADQIGDKSRMQRNGQRLLLTVVQKRGNVNLDRPALVKRNYEFIK